jgi:hypothetical protein
MYETYRMLGKEREAGFERHAGRFRRAAEVARHRRTREAAVEVRGSRSKLGALIGRRVGAEGARSRTTSATASQPEPRAAETGEPRKRLTDDSTQDFGLDRSPAASTPRP